MDGLLLKLLGDRHGSPGQTFWPCFEPLRSTFDRHYWIFLNQPWMGAPLAFDDAQDSVDYEGIGETSVCLWRPGALGRWADQFSEEYVELWAPDPADDPSRLASEFRRTFYGREDSFIEKHAKIWLSYCDSTCWEIFADQNSPLQAVRDHLKANEFVRVYDSVSSDRRRGYEAAGIIGLWYAMCGQPR